VIRSELKAQKNIKGGGMARLILTVGPDDRNYVIRELNPDLLYNWRLRRGFIRGMRIRQMLSPHPNILESKGAQHRRLVPYEIIEYVSGGSLRQLVQQRHSEIMAHHLDILRQISGALVHMHNQHLVHLDVKAENILIKADSVKHEIDVQLTDFDLSRRLRGSWHRFHSGTASYMAPEQITAGRVDYKSDIFAFGVLAYYLLTGKMPFEGFTIEQARYHQIDVKHTAVPPRKHCKDLAMELDSLIMKCLEKNVESRFPAMAYLDQELRRI